MGSNLKKLILSSSVFLSLSVGAQNLIHESETLPILREEGIQKSNAEMERVYSIQYSYVSGAPVFIPGKSDEYRYGLGADSPMVAASFSILPFKKMIEGGFSLSMAYLTQEGRGEVSGEAAQLHLVLMEPSLFAQKEFLNHLYGRMGVGYGLAALFQRGFEDENTSTSRGFGFAYLAADWKMSRLSFFKSNLDWALNLELRRSFGPRSSSSIGELERTSLGFSLHL